MGTALHPAIAGAYLLPLFDPSKRLSDAADAPPNEIDSRCSIVIPTGRKIVTLGAVYSEFGRMIVARLFSANRIRRRNIAIASNLRTPFHFAAGTPLAAS